MDAGTQSQCRLGAQEVMADRQRHDELLTTSEVAELFGVTPRTVTRWAEEGRLTPMRTLGGHRRYPRSQVKELLAERDEEEERREDGG